MNRVFVIIPARYESKRFPGKPLALICNKPMIQHVYERACMCKYVDDVYVATDDKRIVSCVKDFGGKVLLTSKGHRSGTDRIFEAAKLLGMNKKDIIINIQGDQPVFDPSIISLLVNSLKEEAISMATLMYPLKDNKELTDPNCVKVITDKNGFAIYFSRSVIPYNRDKLPFTYYKHIGIYGYKMDFLEVFANLPEGRLEKVERLEQLRAIEYGYKIKVLESPSDSVDVDVPEDLMKLNKAICPEKS